jgi:hypothetical protein
LANLTKSLARKTRKVLVKKEIAAKATKECHWTRTNWSKGIPKANTFEDKSGNVSSRTTRRVVADIRRGNIAKRSRFWRQWHREHPNRPPTEAEYLVLEIARRYY